MNRRATYIAIGLLVGFAGGWLLRDSAEPGTTATAEARPSASRTPFSVEGRPSRGPEDAAVEFVEFTDYQCPFCKRFFDHTYPDILAEYEDRVKFVVRNFPLRSIHPHAQKAAEAAECAFDQGRFWEFHDLVFADPERLDVESLKGRARELGLDRLSFDECLDSGRMREVVERDQRDGIRFGVNGTPAFFINGQVLVGAQPTDVVRMFIEMALEESAAG